MKTGSVKKEKRIRNTGIKKEKRISKTGIKKTKKIRKKNQFFNEMITELFLLLEMKKSRFENVGIFDLWYHDVGDLLFLFKKFKKFYGRNRAPHCCLNLVVVAIAITFYQRFFDKIVYRAASEIILKSRSKLGKNKLDKDNFMDFYSSVEDSIENIFEAKGECFVLTSFSGVLASPA